MCDRVAGHVPKVSEPEVVLALRQLGGVWEQLFPVERQRIVRLLVLNALARAHHWQRLLDEGRMSSGVEIAGFTPFCVERGPSGRTAGW
ncbi:MAG: hypothetical protein NFW15_08840, partial [Candidatus Accumulibacter sp.]|nr:hypothetical protein [Accumulibacter sp.]